MELRLSYEAVSENPSSAPRQVTTGDGQVLTGESDLRSTVALAAGVLAIPVVIIGVVLFALIPGPWWLGVILGLVVAAGLIWIRLRNADQRVLSNLGGGLLQADGAARLENLVQSLSLAGGVEEPEVVILSDPARNALAMRNRGRNTLVVTQGLLQSLEVVELEGVVAELLSRLKNGDAESATLGAALFGQPILDGPLSSVLGPVANIGLARLLHEDRDLEADRAAVRLTRYPPGLLNALKHLRGGPAPTANTDGLAHLWLVDPVTVDEPARAPLDLRIDVLAEL